MTDRRTRTSTSRSGRLSAAAGAALAALLFGVVAASAAPSDDFFTAIRADNAGLLRSVLQSGVDPNSRSDRGVPGLTLAMQEQSRRSAKLLLEQPGIDVDALNPAGESALMIAAIKGDLPDVKALIEHGARIQQLGWSPLHYAAIGPEPAILGLLLERGAAVDAPSPNGSTPLMLAAQYGSEDNVKLLLAAGADWRLRNDKSLTAVDFARLGGREFMVRRFEALQR